MGREDAMRRGGAEQECFGHGAECVLSSSRLRKPYPVLDCARTYAVARYFDTVMHQHAPPYHTRARAHTQRPHTRARARHARRRRRVHYHHHRGKLPLLAEGTLVRWAGRVDAAAGRAAGLPLGGGSVRGPGGWLQGRCQRGVAGAGGRGPTQWPRWQGRPSMGDPAGLPARAQGTERPCIAHVRCSSENAQHQAEQSLFGPLAPKYSRLQPNFRGSVVYSDTLLNAEVWKIAEPKLFGDARRDKPPSNVM